jgi:photosystem II stability/assembly factor-like uncharacterized protein
MPKKPTNKTNAKKDTSQRSGAAAGSKKVSPPRNETTQESSQKKRPKGGAVRLTNHKTRSKWFQARSSWPVREAPVNRLVRERARAKKRLAAVKVEAKWECVGPYNVGGRVTSLVCHPKHPDRLWLGAAGGGVWHSPNGGRSWKSCWKDQDILNIGSLAIDQRNPKILYCGTGEANLSSDCYPGVGLYHSTDAGRTWQLLASSNRTGIPRGIGVIAIDPFDSKHLLIGGVGFAEVSAEKDSLGGLYYSHDGGVSWERETFISTKNYWCHSIVFHPAKRGVVFATFTEQGSRSGIWRSTDGGESWTHLTEGLPDSALFGRTSLAISRSKPDVMYAFAADENSASSDLMLGVFRSADGGESWEEISKSHFANEGQISYNNTIVVHPKKHNYVICGGVDLHRTTDGGKTWRRITRWDFNRGHPQHAHSDHHTVLMPTAKPGLVYDANDGGLDVSKDGGDTWENRSDGLAITMFYDLDVAPSDGAHYGGGAQDNGTVVTKTGDPGSFERIFPGDGGWLVYDPENERHLYCSCYNLDIRRYEGTDYSDVSPPAKEQEQQAIWMCYITLDPSNPKRVFTGSHRVWRSDNDGDTWRAVSPKLDGSPISAIEVAPANSQHVYVGTENGGFFRSLDGGTNWSPNISSSVLPGHQITRIESYPTDANVVIATMANFGHGHVFRTLDGGRTWEDIDKGQLPDVPHHVAIIRQDEPEKIYVGNDAGVYVMDSKEGTWSNLSKNLPNAMIVDLVYHEKDGTLSAATYGRSIWRIKLK